ncbi:MAG: transposase [Candidatus Helarchaeota archaeon]
MGRGENEQEITTFCLLLEEKLEDHPKSIVVDYKPAWDLGIKKVFPECLIIRDGFHTVQLINRAIFKELVRISKRIHGEPIKETKQLYWAIKKDAWQGDDISFIPKHDTLKEFKFFYTLLVTLHNIKDDLFFKHELDATMRVLQKLDTEYSLFLWNELLKRLPENGLTRKNLKYYKKKLKGALSLVMREFRRRVERDKKHFTVMRYLLVKREENLSGHDFNSLQDFLKKFPEYKKFHELSLRISNIYHVSPKILTDSIITGIRSWDDAGAPLKAAVNTLKKNVREIFNFKRALTKKVPEDFYKRVRTGPEHAMRKIKDVIRSRFGLRTPEMSQFYLEHQLECQVIVNQGQKAQIAT